MVNDLIHTVRDLITKRNDFEITKNNEILRALQRKQSELSERGFSAETTKIIKGDLAKYNQNSGVIISSHSGKASIPGTKNWLKGSTLNDQFGISMSNKSNPKITINYVEYLDNLAVSDKKSRHPCIQVRNANGEKFDKNAVICAARIEQDFEYIKRFDNYIAKHPEKIHDVLEL